MSWLSEESDAMPLVPVPLRTGDRVLHRPTGETWIVAFVEGGKIAWCGWPDGRADVADCDRIHVATEEEHRQLVRELARLRGDTRGAAVRRLYPWVEQELQLGRSRPPNCPQCGHDEWLSDEGDACVWCEAAC